MHASTVPLRILLFFAALLAFGSAFADNDNESSGSLRISPSSVSMKIGDTSKITVSGASGRVSVESGDKTVASAQYANNVVTLKALKTGTTSVKVSDRSVSRNVGVAVNGASTTGLTVSPTVLSLAAGATASIAVSNPSGTVSVKSSDTSVATVTYATGTALATVKGLKAGTANIEVKDSKTSKTVVVTVGGTSGTALTASPSYVAISVGSSGNVTLSNASGALTAAISSDVSVATANISGMTVAIKGVKAGTASITVKDSKSSAVVQVSVASGPVTASGGYALLAWNDLGMHCVDGKDYSIFSILPPYNNLHAQLVNKSTGKQVTSGVTLTYEAIPDDTVANTDPLFGSINTTSYTKTNFWTYVQKLFGASPAIDIGLNLTPNAPGNQTPSLKPKEMSFASANGWYQAEGLPVVPYDDKGLSLIHI